MGGIIFDVVIALVFAFEAFKLLSKKNGGSQRMEEKYTAESLRTYSLVSGIAMVFATLFEVFLIFNKLGVLHILDDMGDSWIGSAIRIGPLILVIIIALVSMAFLKKKDVSETYTDSASHSKKSDEDEDF